MDKYIYSCKDKDSCMSTNIHNLNVKSIYMAHTFFYNNICTLNSAYNEKNVEIFLHYRQLFVKGNIFIGEWGIFGVEIFLCYS